MAPTGLSSFPNGVDEVQYVVDDGDGRKKTKKWLIGGVVFGVILIIMIAFVVLKQTGVVEKVISGGKMSRTELVEIIDQVNLDLDILSKNYNSTFNYEEQKEGETIVMTPAMLEKREKECGDVETELMELPNAEKVSLTDETKQDYATLYDEVWDRYNTIKSGLTLSRQFNEAFFWPTITVNAGEKQIQPEGQELLLNSSNTEVSKVANAFKGLYQLAKNGVTEEGLTNFSNANSSIVREYYDCFPKIDDPDGFYDRINTFVEELEK